MFARLISRTTIAKGRAGIDDAFILLATVVVIACNVCATFAVNNTNNEHIKSIHQTSQELIVTNAIMGWTFTLPKFAILALLQRIFMIPRHTLIAFWGLCTLTISVTLATTIVWAVSCKSASGDSQRPFPKETCQHKDVIQGLMWATGALSASGDLLFSVYPQFLISKLNMSFQKRVAYGLALGLGVFAFVASVYKLTLYPRGFFMPGVVFGSHSAQTYDMNIVFWALVESNVLIITACLPTLGPCCRFVKENTTHYKRGGTQPLRRLPDEHTIGSPPEVQESQPRPETGDDLAHLEAELKHQSRQFRDSLRMADKLASEDGSDPEDIPSLPNVSNNYGGGILKRVDIEQWHEARGSREPSRNNLGLLLEHEK